MASAFITGVRHSSLELKRPYICRRCRDKNILIECACGCGGIRILRDKRGRQFAYINKQFHAMDFKSGKDNLRWRGGRRLNNKGYVLIYKPEHPLAHKVGCVLEHRWIMEQYLGRLLEPDEDVHHINGIKTDNRIENLQLLTHVGHTIMTLTGRKASLETKEKLRISHLGRRKWLKN